MPATRRDFLQQASGITAGLTFAQHPAKQDPLLPTVKLGPHSVTRLIVGGNLVYGYSHFNKIFSKTMSDWHTPDRVQELLTRCESVGVNTFQNSYAERTLADVDRYREAGGKMHWLCLGKPDWDKFPKNIDDAAKHKPIGIAPHGALAEKLHRANNLTTLTDLLKRIRQTGVLVGLSAHNPAVIELAGGKRLGRRLLRRAASTISPGRGRNSRSCSAATFRWAKSISPPTRRGRSK